MLNNALEENSLTPRILIIDDEKRIRDGCTKTLCLEKFQVSTADSGSMGLEKIENEHYDVVLLDLMMPGLSGMDVLTHIKNLHPETLVIVITGYATLDHAIEAMKKGAFDFISKPFSPKDLRLTVTKAMEHINTLQDIATEKSRMRTLVNQLSCGVMITDDQKMVALANTAFLKMMNFSGDIIGYNAQDIVKCDELKEIIDQALSMPGFEFAELSCELVTQRSGKGREGVLNARCVPFRDRRERTLGSITVLYDITALKKLDQIKSDFVSMVSHEIRSPMNSVLAQLKVVLDGLAGEITTKQQEILQRASEKINALVSLSSELLDLAQIESGLISQDKEKIDMAQLLTENVNFHVSSAQQKEIHLDLDQLPELPPVLCNRVNMEEVLSNLISNAIKYTPDGGQICVSASADKEFLCITVKDNGFGIPSEDIDHIFDRFYRVKNDKTRYITGTGLGLAIVKEIINAHNGIIRVESEENKGTTFYAFIPIFK
ncbi:response regulator [Thermodesulfobacteriota bacterium]